MSLVHALLRRMAPHQAVWPLPLFMAIGFSAAVLGDALAQTPPSTVRLRGTVVSVTPETLTVKDCSVEVVELVITSKLVVSEVFPIALEDIRPGSHIGAAAMPQTDGTQRAIAVSVFPEAACGTGESHRPLDLLPQSTMTNATVENVGTMADPSSGRLLKLKYKDGEKTVVVQADAAIVTSRPGDRSLLVAGASVSLFARVGDGKPVVQRIKAGKNGFALPY